MGSSQALRGGPGGSSPGKRVALHAPGGAGRTGHGWLYPATAARVKRGKQGPEGGCRKLQAWHGAGTTQPPAAGAEAGRMGRVSLWKTGVTPAVSFRSREPGLSQEGREPGGRQLHKCQLHHGECPAWLEHGWSPRSCSPRLTGHRAANPTCHTGALAVTHCLGAAAWTCHPFPSW